MNNLIRSVAIFVAGALLLWGGLAIWERLQQEQKKVVVLDPGHGGDYPGFEQNGLLEKDIVLAVAQKTKSILEQKGYRVYMTRERDQACSEKGYVADLACRPALARKYDADVFVSIHANAFVKDPRVRGVEAFYFTPFRDKEAAEAIGAAIADAAGLPLRFTKFANYKVLRDSIVPSTLVEIGYMTNKQDAAVLADKGLQQKIASGLAEGIQAFIPVEQP